MDPEEALRQANEHLAKENAGLIETVTQMTRRSSELQDQLRVAQRKQVAAEEARDRALHTLRVLAHVARVEIGEDY